MDIRDKIKLFPHSPGVYRYYDAEGNVIYVGKAKDLHKRVAQYFVPAERLTRKTAVMVSKIADAQYTVVESEADALLLENNLIKQFKPRYNILLKDSKTYPWICVTAEDFPRVFLTRRLVKDGSRYFGPYSSVVHARNLVDFIHSVYPLRTCKHKITSDVILRGKIRPCLNFHIKKCRGCCVGGISQKEYNENIEEIVSLLKGGGREVIQHYKTLMTEAAQRMEFEQAQVYKEKMQSLEKHYSKSVIMNAAVGDVDVFSLIIDGPEAFGNFLRIKGGAVVQSLNLGFKLMIEEEQEAVLGAFVAEIQSKFGELSKEIIVPFKPDVEIGGVEFRVPVRGDKLALLELSARNAKEMRLNALKQQEHTDPDAYKNMVMESLQKQLGMKELPVHIECFDNSNIQGTNPVSACVVFRNAVPSKKDYRHFKVKTVVGANDYATMKEVVNRRYSRMLEENPDDLPQLIVIDGGKGQLSFAYEALSELGLIGKVTLIALAERMEEVYRVGDPYPMFIDRNSPALKVLQQIRDEAHRFGITFHRNLRSKAQVQSVLKGIKGVGEKTEQRLLLRFGSVARIKAASLDEISELVGPVLAERILDHLSNDQSERNHSQSERNHSQSERNHSQSERSHCHSERSEESLQQK
ncbi:MAG: excinuclease ABC subunit C [Bacteroidales bacterium]|nr:excinuclease ABC subunit C [Bacteroidales bacterium]